MVRLSAAEALPVLLGIVAILSFGGWLAVPGYDLPAGPEWQFPASVPPDEAEIVLASCTTIEEAMLGKVMGVVCNASTNALAYATAHIRWLDSKGDLLDESCAPVVPEIVRPGHEARFVAVTRPNAGVRTICVVLTGVNGAPLEASYSRPAPPVGFVQP